MAVQLKSDSPIKAVVSVAQMCRLLNMSRSQFYWHVKRGTFHAPQYLASNKRPYFTASMVEDNLRVRETGIGVNNDYVIFYERQAVEPKPPERKAKTTHASLIEGLKALGLPALKDQLAERILDETDVVRMIALERTPRNKAILLTLYAGGFRVSEACSLKWGDLQRRDSAGQITVFGKGGKTRTVLIPESVWNALMSLRGEANDNAPVFRSRKGGHLDESQVWRVVRKASERAEIDKDVSCHWLRHAHASHALDHGAPIHLVQATLGHSSISTTGRYLHARPSESSGNYLRF